MPNTDAPRGLRVLKNPFGTTPQMKIYQATSAVIYRGQLVRMTAAGTIEGISTSAPANTDVQILGIAQHYKAASAADASVHVTIDQGDLQYVIQSDDATLDDLTDYVGLNFTAINANAGSTSTGDSSMELDGSTGATAAVTGGTTANVFRIIDLYSGVDNRVVSGDATESANADFVVKLNPQFLHFANSVGI